jgi:flagellin-like protein
MPAPSADRTRAVSPVVGAALMLVVVVLLAAILASLAFGFTDALREPAPMASFDVDYVPDGAGNAPNGAYVNISHEAGSVADGSRVYVRDDAGNEVAWKDIWTGDATVAPGGYVHVDGRLSDGALRSVCEAGQTYYVVVERADGSSAILREVTVPSDPAVTNSDC